MTKSEKMHQALPVHGYSPVSDEDVRRVNGLKLEEERLLRQLDMLGQMPDFDQRWLAIGRAAIEQGFSAVYRSILRPARATLPEDKAKGK